MNFPRALLCLVLASLALPLQARIQEVQPPAQGSALQEVVQGGGEVTLDGTTYRFEPTSVSALPARAGLPPLIRLAGRLVPGDPASAFDFELSLLKDGTLYMLRILRKAPGAYPDSWSATAKTRARLSRFDPTSGAKLEIACSGPLTGVVGRRPRNAAWHGALWAILP